VKLTGSQTLAKLLKAHGVEYVAGIPGYGSWSIVDALQSATHGIPFIQVMQEQSCVYMADGYYRACGRPMAALVPTVIDVSRAVSGIACARAEASAVLVISGAQSSHIPTGGMTAAASEQCGDCSPMSVKAQLTAESPAALPEILRSAFFTMIAGGPGPVSLTVPVDVQVQSVELKLTTGQVRLSPERPAAPALEIARASECVAKASRPVIVAGARVMAGEACHELLEVAQSYCIPLLTSADGKGAIAEDHPLAGGSVGRWGSACANQLLSSADLVLLVGSSPDDLESTAPVIQIDLDPGKFGRPVQVQLAIEADIRGALDDLSRRLSAAQRKKTALQRAAYLMELSELRSAWEVRLNKGRTDESSPFIIQRPLAELRAVLERDAVVVVGAGGVRRAVQQMFPVYVPRSHLSSSIFGASGWAVPAAIGAKLALPARQVVCVVGDGEFIQAMQELAVCVMHCIPVLFVVFNNSGYVSLRDGQTQVFGRHNGSEFNLPDGKPYSPDFTEIARSFGLESWRVELPSQLRPVLHKAINSKGPALIEVIISRQSNGAIDPFSNDVT
jgi:acetolactate synthase-1/2/3 large subunit